MRCPECRSTAVKERPERTAQGYRRFRCLDCAKQFNERSTGLLNRTQYPSDVIALVVLWRLRYKLQSARSGRDVPDPWHRVQLRGRPRLGSEIDARFGGGSSARPKGQNRPKLVRRRDVYSGAWPMEVSYRAIDRDGALVDVMLSERRNLAAAKRFFRSAKAVTGVIPDRVTTDGHDAYPQAIRTELGSRARHRTKRYLNNRLEQDHRGIKGRCRPMLGFKSVPSAKRYCRSHDELRNFLRCRSRMCQNVPAATRRFHHMRRTAIALGILEAA